MCHRCGWHDSSLLCFLSFISVMEIIMPLAETQKWSDWTFLYCSSYCTCGCLTLSVDLTGKKFSRRPSCLSRRSESTLGSVRSKSNGRDTATNGRSDVAISVDAGHCWQTGATSRLRTISFQNAKWGQDPECELVCCDWVKCHQPSSFICCSYIPTTIIKFSVSPRNTQTSQSRTLYRGWRHVLGKTSTDDIIFLPVNISSACLARLCTSLLHSFL